MATARNVTFKDAIDTVEAKLSEGVILHVVFSGRCTVRRERRQRRRRRRTGPTGERNHKIPRGNSEQRAFQSVHTGNNCAE